VTASRAPIPVAQPFLGGNEAKYVNDCLDTGWVSSIGRYVEEFESQFAEYCDVRYAVSCNSGTSALHLALTALGVGPGDEVLVPSMTYVATANAVRYCGATPVFVDSQPDTFNIDPEDIERRITPRTRGIIAVHLYGHPADMRAIGDIARRHAIFAVEDAAEAHGARCGPARVGSLADIGTFSFFGNKIMTTGEGGMVTTDDPELNRRLRLYRGQGMDPDRRYWFEVVGFNYRMTNIQAAIGVAQLEMIETHLMRRMSVATWYDRHLAPLRHALRLPVRKPWAQPVNWLYTVVVTPPAAVARDDLIVRLAADGIETRPTFVPVHTLPPYRDPAVSLPIAEGLGAHGLSLPTYAGLTENDVEYVAQALRRHVTRSY
jgi:perosamine synthetase